LIETETRIRNVIVLDPVYRGDSTGHVYRTLCTRLGYYRPPRDVSYIMIPVCQGCWKQELRLGDTGVVELPCRTPGHAICTDCSVTLEKCPYTGCPFGNIPFKLLANDESSDGSY
jgi:hypothetical protein